MELVVDDMATGYPELVETIVSCGRRRSPRGQGTHELQNCTVVLTDPTKAHPNGQLSMSKETLIKIIEKVGEGVRFKFKGYVNGKR